ncbi:efflux transporter outer membrane subunit [Paraburkholderia caballeronis]|uniref:efflux transporter outer membrane subunit n=1 Tax=Paraburkholderia caballeronis TaxID=416943 RepID=UPI00106509FF|nr:efflux transporter outer membrane subunit [Paraburkholderia caballeronis]TDV04356.1 NodT family efflux transporter outer membrane factor (OMF) lipoprotein [Paraburkholderia caballeronis]TDV17714.1 NodT family efflux transporter outer membrane factor (OMF) lipoprotein [Paraburkholderia caballeronis]TDV18744.1 NodT family efflux transporter outer membrane factor (OMF) lipoprotein [Paraburkholderia caballeronis]
MKNWTVGFAILALSACSVTPPDGRAVPTPATWQYAGADRHGAPVRADWWTAFGNDELDRLMETAARDSFDVAAAVARVRQARAAARIAGAPLLPTVSGFADASRQGGLLVSDTELEGTSFDIGLAASYELDFWGRNRALRRAAGASLEASAFDRDTVALTVGADVADAWLQTAAFRQRTDIAAQNLATAQAILNTVESRFRAGAATSLELAQQRATVAAQRGALSAQRQQANASLVTLAALLGQPVAALHLATASLDAMQVPDVDAGVPSAVLVQRPDLARAEAQLAAADANIAAARAAMLPGVTLTATAGFGNDRIHTLFDNSLYSVAAGLTAPIFNGGALAAGRDLAVAQKEELLANYHAAIVAAFADVERALNAIDGVDAQIAANGEQLDEARRALRLATSRYRAGAEPLVVVLTAQQTLYAAEDEKVQLRLARLSGAVSLYRALGGGWMRPPDERSAG